MKSSDCKKLPIKVQVRSRTHLLSELCSTCLPHFGLIENYFRQFLPLSAFVLSEFYSKQSGVDKEKFRNRFPFWGEGGGGISVYLLQILSTWFGVTYRRYSLNVVCNKKRYPVRRRPSFPFSRAFLVRVFHLFTPFSLSTLFPLHDLSLSCHRDLLFYSLFHAFTFST